MPALKPAAQVPGMQALLLWLAAAPASQPPPLSAPLSLPTRHPCLLPTSLPGLLPAAREHAGQRDCGARQVPQARRLALPLPRPHVHGAHPQQPVVRCWGRACCGGHARAADQHVPDVAGCEHAPASCAHALHSCKPASFKPQTAQPACAPPQPATAQRLPEQHGGVGGVPG